MSIIKTSLRKRNKARYNLHYRIRTQYPEDASILNTARREFETTPNSELGKRLVNDFGYTIVMSLFKSEN